MFQFRVSFTVTFNLNNTALRIEQNVFKRFAAILLFVSVTECYDLSEI